MIMNWIEISKWKRREKKEKSDLENGHGFLNFIINILCVCAWKEATTGKVMSKKMSERRKRKSERASQMPTNTIIYEWRAYELTVYPI